MNPASFRRTIPKRRATANAAQPNGNRRGTAHRHGVQHQCRFATVGAGLPHSSSKTHFLQIHIERYVIDQANGPRIEAKGIRANGSSNRQQASITTTPLTVPRRDVAAWTSCLSGTKRSGEGGNQERRALLDPRCVAVGAGSSTMRVSWPTRSCMYRYLRTASRSDHRRYGYRR